MPGPEFTFVMSNGSRRLNTTVPIDSWVDRVCSLPPRWEMILFAVVNLSVQRAIVLTITNRAAFLYRV